ncbi:MAG: CHAT domain-containing protein [Acidobacteria bacterium]|nr:CHAT domain-containing protein [Acidobacteriota bacterium]
MCGSGSALNALSRVLLAQGGNALVGFVGPVTDHAGRILAAEFYEQVNRGSSLGEAMETARERQKRELRHDLSWASLVLFGDPTARFV